MGAFRKINNGNKISMAFKKNEKLLKNLNVQTFSKMNFTFLPWE